MPDAEQPEILLAVSTRRRSNPRVAAYPCPRGSEPDARSVMGVPGVPGAWGWTLAGGEPTLRADLPRLVRWMADSGLPRPGLATDGLAFSERRNAETLRMHGLERVRLPLAAGRPDANDWIAARAGTTRRVRRAIEVCVQARLSVEIDLVVTRPTAPHLVETVEVCAALGARAVHLCAPHPATIAPSDGVALLPRLRLILPALEAAVRRARSFGLRADLHGFPFCAAPVSDEFRARPGAERWILPEGLSWPDAEPVSAAAPVARCPRCPADCPGIDATYVDLFGWSETERPGGAG